MLRFVTYALPLLFLLLALFGFAVEMFDAEPREGSVIRLSLSGSSKLPAAVILGAWLMEACGLLALFLIARGRFARWWIDGLVTGWLAWVFRGPLLVITMVVAVRQPQHAWWTLVFGWWALYSVCGLTLAFLYRQMEAAEEEEETDFSYESVPVASPAPLDESLGVEEDAQEGESKPQGYEPEAEPSEVVAYPSETVPDSSPSVSSTEEEPQDGDPPIESSDEAQAEVESAEKET